MYHKLIGLLQTYLSYRTSHDPHETGKQVVSNRNPLQIKHAPGLMLKLHDAFCAFRLRKQFALGLMEAFF